MKIIQFTSSLLAPLGGAEQYCIEISRWLRDQGHDVTIMTGWISPEVQESLAAEGLPVTVVRSRRPYPPDRKGPRPAAVLFHLLDLLGTVRLSPTLHRAVRDADVVHVHRLHGFGTAILRHPGVAMTVHDYGLVDTTTMLLRHGNQVDAPLVQRLRAALIGRTARTATLIFPTGRLRDKHAAWGLRMPERTEVIPHGWRMKATVAEPKTGPVVFLYLGKLVTTKGVELLLEAWGEGISGAELWIAGAGDLEPEVLRAAAAGRVRYLGWVDAAQRSAALSSASALVVPSLWPENFPLVAAEAVLAGLPLISTTIAAPPVLEHRGNGLLAEPNAVDLRGAMVTMLSSSRRAELASGSRTLAGSLDFDLHGNRIVRLYNQIVPGASGVGSKGRGLQ
ncbi:glycosyltransferase [Salinibacterium sp. G-O1]|uniref:glycosyltransferase n=1 Tax=Salinibacterium sp. G-O1 TaxID=3046208 RepID=UPI0024B98593|nr:glycosyltransferase [Salinibacterium sp. G-O1]MDJ0333775.1 glycosyltransferase [Salinibacterium sp. G-O1]